MMEMNIRMTLKEALAYVKRNKFKDCILYADLIGSKKNPHLKQAKNNYVYDDGEYKITFVGPFLQTKNLTPLMKIGNEANNINIMNGWKVFEPGDWIESISEDKAFQLSTHMSLFHEEISEANRAIRKNDKANFEEELADIIIRVTSTAYGLGLDLDKAVAAKLEKNKARGYKYGGKVF